MKSSGMARVLVVEDEMDVASLVKHAIERGGDATVEVATSGAGALELVTRSAPDLGCSI